MSSCNKLVRLNRGPTFCSLSLVSTLPFVSRTTTSPTPQAHINLGPPVATSHRPRSSHLPTQTSSMDPQTDLPDLVEDLEVNIDELTSTLAPLLPPNTLSKTATSLPLLEKSKLHVLAAYAIESVLFSTLQASGADAKSHAIFQELARLKGYFGKIKSAEDHFKNLAEKEGRARLDVGAAQRFIKHGLAGNERYDELRQARMKAEKERALEKARKLTNKKFSDDEATPGKRAVEDADEEQSTPNKKRKGGAEEEQQGEQDKDTPAPAPKKRGRKSKKTDLEGDDTQEDPSPDAHEDAGADDVDAEAMDLDTLAPAKKKRGRPSKKDKAAAGATPQKDTPTRSTRSSAPKTRTEAFQALASGSPTASSSKAKGKGRGKK
jgi:exosome complex protein LRP1